MDQLISVAKLPPGQHCTLEPIFPSHDEQPTTSTDEKILTQDAPRKREALLQILTALPLTKGWCIEISPDPAIPPTQRYRTDLLKRLLHDDVNRAVSLTHPFPTGTQPNLASLIHLVQPCPITTPPRRRRLSHHPLPTTVRSRDLSLSFL